MTDLEMVKACAEAMGLSWIGRIEDRAFPECNRTHWVQQGTIKHRFDPLTNDAQAMALVKKFNLVIEREKGGILFAVTAIGYATPSVIRAASDLNRAIVECVAMTQRKSEA